MKHPFIVYLYNKTSLEFEYKSNVSAVVRTDNGFLITFTSGKTYRYGVDKVKYYPLVSTRENVHIYENGKLNKRYNTVDNYGRYLVYRDGDSCSTPIENSNDIEICDIKKNTKQAQSIINYFKEILEKSGGISFEAQSEEKGNKNLNKISSEILLKALDNIDLSESRSALSNYINGVNPPGNAPKETLIYPFGCNESQKLAVETAFTNRISIIEGPPGTGKTQTILNIIANLITQNKTAAIVSNNNSAIFNVREKLKKYGYGIVIASLGNNENKASFFDNIETQKIDKNFKISKEKLIKASNKVQDLESILTMYFQYRNKSAILEAELADAEIEFSHIKAEQPLDQNIKFKLDNKFHRSWNFNKALKINRLLSNIDIKKKLSIINKLRFILQYGFFDLNNISRYNEELYIYVNHKFYELYIAKIKAEKLNVESWLEAHNGESSLEQFIEISKTIFNGKLYEKYSSLDKTEFNIEDYRQQFDDFTKHYPVILSSTLSLHTSIPNGYLFDYLIIDESSQVDIIKASICFSCCRNVVIVGDSMQLNHIVDKQSKEIAESIQKANRIVPAYNYVEQNILTSLKSLYRDNIRSVLLKEHYRCHPKIIGFCNKKYYNNNLVIMTNGNNDHPFKIIETNIAGSRDNHNQRQVDETNLFIRENYSTDYTKVGVIAPYRNQVDRLQKQLPDGVEADTIHKYQGREKDTIIFNTVKNQIEPFIDNPNLINVAVSRAVKEFVVVKPVSMNLPHGTNIGDMIRYICYTTDPKETVVKGRICSVFDLLYKEYNKIFTSFLLLNKNEKGSAAEIIIGKLLRNILSNNHQFSAVDFVREYKLRDLVRNYLLFSAAEIKFIKNNSRLDFLLYNKIDKTPILAIEVDGISFHSNELQQERDNKKNHILKIIGLPLIRLSTDGHNEESKIIENLENAMRL